jgi:anti-sigma B factor antagonist
VIIPLNRVSVGAAVPDGEVPDGEVPDGEVPDGGSDGAVITPKRVEPAARLELVKPEPVKSEPDELEAVPPEAVQLELSCRTGPDGNQVISVTGELDIATAEQAYAYISEVIDSWPTMVSVDLSGLTFCDASGLGALAKIARHARQAGRQLRLTSARPSLLKIIRLTGLDSLFPELRPPVPAYSALAPARPADRPAR